MLSLLIICLIAGGLGAILQGMLGIGTGIIVVPLLTLILPYYGVDQDLAIHIALATSMAAIATNSISALWSHYRRGNVKWEMFKKIIIFSMCGSYLGAVTATRLSGFYLQLIFGGFLLFTAAYMLFKKQVGEEVDTLADLSLPKLATGGFSIGLVASIVGSGGGILMVPFLHALKLKMRYAVGTSTLIGFPVAVIGAFTYTFIGLSQTLPTSNTIGYLHWPAFLAITCAGSPPWRKIFHAFTDRSLAPLICFLDYFYRCKNDCERGCCVEFLPLKKGGEEGFSGHAKSPLIPLFQRGRSSV